VTPGEKIWLMARNAGNSALALVKTIERNGGVLEDDWDSEHGRVRRYWIDLGESTG
jgi:predicted acetyltransferase